MGLGAKQALPSWLCGLRQVALPLCALTALASAERGTRVTLIPGQREADVTVSGVEPAAQQHPEMAATCTRGKALKARTCSYASESQPAVNKDTLKSRCRFCGPPVC